MDIKASAEKNFEDLKKNSYPGRGIIAGTSADGKKYFQIYWIMGRSANSRNRIFELEPEGFLKTKAYDESKVEDPSLIIYYPLRHINGYHIATNGDQTDTIYSFIAAGKTFQEALDTREYEPDGPNFTPRISAITEPENGMYAYRLSIIKTMANDEACSGRYLFSYRQGIPGYGHFISTYNGDGKPLPSFTGEPRIMPVFDSAEENLETYWNALNEDNRISLLVKEIDRETGNFRTIFRNRFA